MQAGRQACCSVGGVHYIGRHKTSVWYVCLARLRSPAHRYLPHSIPLLLRGNHQYDTCGACSRPGGVNRTTTVAVISCGLHARNRRCKDVDIPLRESKFVPCHAQPHSGRFGAPRPDHYNGVTAVGHIRGCGKIVRGTATSRHRGWRFLCISIITSRATDATGRVLLEAAV